ncbi:MAG: tetratricopeptide repeat protein [bacterium]
MDRVKLQYGVIIFLFILFFPAYLSAVPSHTITQKDTFINPNTTINLKSDVNSEEENLKKKQIEEHSYKATKFSYERKFDKALEEYKKILELDPNMAMAHNDIAWTYIQRNKPNDLPLAERELLEAIRLDPNLILAHRNLWWVYRLQDKKEIAVKQLEKIIQFEPDKAENYINLADGYLSDVKDFSQAAETYKKALKIKPENHIYSRLAKALEYQGKYKEAIQVLETIIKKSPKDCYPYLFLAVILGKSGKKEQIPERMKAPLKVIQEEPFTARQNEWPIKLMKFYSGELSEKDLLSDASLHSLWETQAFYYIGMKYVWESNKEKAISYLKQCIEKKNTRSAEFEYAKIELYLLEKK